MKPGDMVRIVRSNLSYTSNRVPPEMIGKIGTITRSHPAAWFTDFPCWDVAIDGHDMWFVETALRLIPPDPGREVIEWDWRELITKQPECV